MSTDPLLAPSPRRYLVVDDNRDQAGSLCTLLRTAGNEAQAVHDGETALRAAGLFRPDVVLLDLGLPRLDGYDTCRALRRLPGGDQLLIVAITGWGGSEDRERTEAAGFSAHLVKPVRYAGLMRLVEELHAR
ncbi:MAG TPA: response regulator [Candidatus Binatia bacterium]|nr:response regulator [Candidatus Binatia bacterium]